MPSLASPRKVPDALVGLAQVLIEDDKIYLWFISLERAPRNYRLTQLKKLSARVREGAKAPDISATLDLLQEDAVYRAVLQTAMTLRHQP